MGQKVWKTCVTGVVMAKTLKTSPEGRECKSPNCGRRLSIYNHSNYCRIHYDDVSRKKVLNTPYYHHA